MNVENPLITITINEQQISVPKGTTVYQAAKKLNIEIPIFCYLDRMPPFGACRMCLVEVEKMPKLQASCTLEATEGMIVKTQTPNAVAGRSDIIEFLLLNHPLDCPICDRGGECVLQDHAYNHGPGESRFFEEKRKFKKPYPLGPVLTLDRERCIACARCTRFGDEVAGDHALELLERGYRTEVGTPDGGPAKSKYIGNTIMICPVGALTSSVYRFRARPWDNQPTNTTCTLCPVGCSMILDSRDGEIMRTRSLENKEVNDIWMCDKGWFGYEFVQDQERLKVPFIKKEGVLKPASWEEALSLIAEKLQQAKSSGKIAAFGGNPLTTEENYLFQKLIKEVVGVNHIDHRIGTPIFSQEEEGIPSGTEISLRDCETLDSFSLLGVDLTEEFPVIWLRLKQAINCGAESFFLGHFLPEISHHLTKATIHAPGDEIEAIKTHLKKLTDQNKTNQKNALFIGSQYLASPKRKFILKLLLEFRKKHPNYSLNILEAKENSIGARLAGMRPDLNPLGEPSTSIGLNAIQILESAAKEDWKVFLVAGANPTEKFPSTLWNKARQGLDFLVVQDLFLTETAKQADVVLPVLSYTEKTGTFVNIEGRTQKILPGKEIPQELYSDGEIFIKIAEKLGHSLKLDSSFLNAISKKIIPQFNVSILSFDATEHNPSVFNDNQLSASFAPALFDTGVRMKHNGHLLGLSKEPLVRLHPKDASSRSIQEGTKIIIKANGNEIYAKATLDKGVAMGGIIIPIGFSELKAQELSLNLINGLKVEVTNAMI